MSLIRDKVILFDLDGTLIDSTEAILESFHYAFNYFRVKVPNDENIKDQIGHPLDVMFKILGINETVVWEFVAKYKEHYQTISRAKTYLLPHAKEALKEASKIAQLGVVTTKTGTFSVELLEHLGLMHYFEILIGREHVTYPKPHPEPILKALLKFETDKTNCWMIGDTCMDMQSALAAKINSIGVTCGYGSSSQLSQCTTIVRKNALQAVAYISEN